jgi:uncharacterized protein (TIGR03437 family)
MARLLIGFALFALTATGQDRDLSITWIGQACFVLRAADGPTVITDPPAPSIGYTLGNLTADAVTVTHNHPDHNNVAGIGGPFTLVDGRPVTARQQMTAAGTSFTLIPGFHDNQNGALRGPNTMIRWRQAGLEIAHLGDLGQDQLTDAQVADLQGVDILFMPAGGVLTVAPERAAAIARQLNARVTILMHYRTALGGPATIGSLPAVAAPFAPVIYRPATVVLHQLPATNEVWVMQPVSDATAVNAASAAGAQPIAAGSIASIYGNFIASQTAKAEAYPLPQKIGDTQVLVDGKAAPLYFVSPGQVNVQIPAAQAPGPALTDIRVGGNSVGRAPLNIVSMAPGLFAAANQDGIVNSAAAPARAGEILVVYGTGFGPVTPAVGDGTAAPANPPAAGAPPNVFLQGRQLGVQYAGLAPGLAGVWQINVVLPSDTPTGPALPLTMVSGVESNQLPVAVVRR